MGEFHQGKFACFAGVPLFAKEQLQGVLTIHHRKKLTPGTQWFHFLEMLAGQTAIAIDNAALFSGLQRANRDLLSAYDTTLEGWAKALELRDHETEGHSRRVTAISVQLARAVGLSESDVNHLRHGALLHDIGKVGIPDEILRKKGPLSEEEWAVMRTHPQLGHDLLMGIEYLRPGLDIPLCHHEKWDGTGYPRRLKENQNSHPGADLRGGGRVGRADLRAAVPDCLDPGTGGCLYRRAVGEPF